MSADKHINSKLSMTFLHNKKMVQSKNVPSIDNIFYLITKISLTFYSHYDILFYESWSSTIQSINKQR